MLEEARFTQRLRSAQRERSDPCGRSRGGGAVAARVEKHENVAYGVAAVHPLQRRQTFDDQTFFVMRGYDKEQPRTVR